MFKKILTSIIHEVDDLFHWEGLHSGGEEATVVKRSGHSDGLLFKSGNAAEDQDVVTTYDMHGIMCSDDVIELARIKTEGAADRKDILA